MRWHLCDGAGAVVRSCEAENVHEARFRLAPIPTDHLVVSAVSYQHPTPIPSGTVRMRLAKPKSHAQQVRAEIRARHERRKRGEHIPLRAKGTPNEKLRRLVLEANVQGETDSAIARRIKMSVEGVRHTRLVVLGLPSAPERMAQRIRTYATLGWSAADIARRLGIWPSNAARVLRRAHGIQG